jgi:DNA-binding protein WhiA
VLPAAEMAALLRFAGGLHIVSGRVVVEAELDTGPPPSPAPEIAEVYGYPSEFHVLASGGLRKGSHYIVRVVKDGEALARQTGLLDVRGPSGAGLPPHVVSANTCCAVAAWRAPSSPHGSLTEPGRSCALEITCPGPESALALVGRGPAHRVAAKNREVRGVDRVVVKDGDAIAALLTRIGAHASVLSWEERGYGVRCARPPTAWRTSTTPTCAGRPAPRSPRRPGSTRALEILGNDAPWHLTSAGC